MLVSLRRLSARLLALALVLLVAGWLRVTHHNWDQDQHMVPDEYVVTQTTLDKATVPPNASLADLLDPRRSPINPRPPDIQYIYGSLPPYITRAVTLATASLTGDSYFTGYDGTEQAGRVLAGLFDTLTTLLVFAIGLRLWGVGAGLLASALYALAVLPVHLGHMYLSDPFMVCFMTAALLCSVLYYQTRRSLALLLAGLCAGLAMACKMSAAPALVLPLAAIALTMGRGAGDVSWKRALGLAALSLGAALLGLFVGDPFAVLDAPGYLAQLRDQVAIQSGADDRWWTRKYVGTWPVLYPWGQLALLGVGPLVGLAGTLGILDFGFWILDLSGSRRKSKIQNPKSKIPLLLLLGAGSYFATIAFTEAKWVRYLLPLVPYVCLFATALALRVADAAGVRRLGPAARYALPVVLVGSALLGAVAYRAIYGVEHTRVQTSRWMYANIPAGSHVAIEVNDGLMPRPLPGHLNPEQEYRIVWLRMLADFSSVEASDTYRGQLAQADYLVFSPVRPARTVARMPWRYPVQNRYYELLLSGRLGFTPVYRAVSYPSIFGLSIPDDNDWVDSSFIEYDHPPVRVFKKERTLTQAEWDALFADAVRRPSVATRRAP